MKDVERHREFSFKSRYFYKPGYKTLLIAERFFIIIEKPGMNSFDIIKECTQSDDIFLEIRR